MTCRCACSGPISLSRTWTARFVCTGTFSVFDLPEHTLPGSHALVLEVDDCDGVLEGAGAEGLQVFPEETLRTHDGREGREIGMLDHDGRLIVLYFILKAA